MSLMKNNGETNEKTYFQVLCSITGCERREGLKQ